MPMKKLAYVSASVLTAATMAAPALAGTCASRLTAASNVASLLQCLLEQENEINEIARRPPPSAVPAGAILAFDRKCPEENEGLGKWMDIGKDESDRFAGRTLIVAGPRVDRPDNETTVKRDPNDDGGEETVALKLEEMPRHNHSVTEDSPNQVKVTWNYVLTANNDYKLDSKAVEAGRGLNFENARLMADVGGDPKVLLGNAIPHNNMPPFIVLYFCKKL